MNSKTLPLLVCAALAVIGGAFYFLKMNAADPDNGQAPNPTGASVPNVTTPDTPPTDDAEAPVQPATDVVETQPKDTPAPKVTGGIKVPVEQPEIVPEKVKVILSDDPLMSDETRIKALKALADENEDVPSSMALRWLVHQPDRDFKLRDEILMLLGTWNPDWFVGDLVGMANDPAQDIKWRAHCLRHLGRYQLHYLDKQSFQTLDAVAGNANAEALLRAAAIQELSMLCREYRYERTNPDKHKIVTLRVGSGLTAKDTLVRAAAVESAGTAMLPEFSPQVEKLLGDASQPMEIRRAAARALRDIARPESLPVVEAASKSKDEALAKMAAEAVPFALLEQLGSTDKAIQQAAYDRLSKMDEAAAPAFARALDAEVQTEKIKLAKSLLAKDLVDRLGMKIIDRSVLQPLGKNEKLKREGKKGVLLEKKSRVIVIEGEFTLEAGPLEYAAVCKGDNSKLHESALGLHCSPMDVCYALLSCSYIYAGELRDGGRINLPQGAGVMLSVEFDFEYTTPKESKTMRVRVPIEALVWNSTTSQIMKRAPWAFTGSKLWKDPETGKKILMAVIEKSVVAIMADPNALLNTPLDSAEMANVANHNQKAFYVVNRAVVPKRGSPCWLVFEPWAGGELSAKDLEDHGKTLDGIPQPSAPKGRPGEGEGGGPGPFGQ